MTRTAVLCLALLMTAAPLGVASAQDRGGRPDRFEREQTQERPRISPSEALSIARSRARGARFVGTLSSGGDTYVFRFEEPGGRVFDISVDAQTGRTGG